MNPNSDVKELQESQYLESLLSGHFHGPSTWVSKVPKPQINRAGIVCLTNVRKMKHHYVEYVDELTEFFIQATHKIGYLRGKGWREGGARTAYLNTNTVANKLH